MLQTGIRTKENLSISNQLIQVLDQESQAINYLIQNFPDSATVLVEKILQTKGRVIFSGMGKSGHVSKKLVATFSGLKIPALFLHPGEALHGDLGMVKSDDIIIAISKSGTGREFEQIIPVLKSQGNFTSLICCANGKLSFLVDLTVKLPFKKEACTLNLAPTSSSTLCMAFGDALAVVCSQMQGFAECDFAKIHPAGALGKRLLLKVDSLMHKGINLPLVEPNTNFQDLLFAITSKKMGIAIVVEDGKVLGIVTDGDLRRACELGPMVFDQKARDIMIGNPKFIEKDLLAYSALQIMEEFNITSLVVLDKNKKVAGLIHIHDLVKAGL